MEGSVERRFRGGPGETGLFESGDRGVDLRLPGLAVLVTALIRLGLPGLRRRGQAFFLLGAPGGFGKGQTFGLFGGPSRLRGGQLCRIAALGQLGREALLGFLRPGFDDDMDEWETNMDVAKTEVDQISRDEERKHAAEERATRQR